MVKTDDGLQIGDVAAATGMSVHAIRYYEREGLLLRTVDRSGARHRVFEPADVDWLLLINKFRDSGMPIATVRRFAELVRSGPGNEQARLALLRDHQAFVESKLAALQQNLAVIRAKVAVYEEHVREGSGTTLWDPRAPATIDDGTTS